MPRRKHKSSILPPWWVILLIVVSSSLAFYYQKKPPISSAATTDLHIYALDVGQGDAFLIQTPNKTALIDAGTPASKTSELLASHNIKSLDLAVATHPHSDHIGGMTAVLNAFPVTAFLDSGRTHPTATYEKILATIKARNIRFIRATAGQTIELDSVKLEVLNPGKEYITSVRSGGSLENANSVVIRLVYGDFAMLFTGDAEFETEARLMKSGLNLKAQILKVGHHGSRHATSGKFLEAVNPEAAIISVGADNDYGHPAPETLRRLSGLKIYRTDERGTVHIQSDGKSYQIN